MVTEGRRPSVQGLDGEEVVLGSLVVQLPSDGHQASLLLDAELPLLVAADDGVGDLGIDPDVPGGGHHSDHVGPELDALADAGKVIFAGELWRIVVDI